MTRSGELAAGRTGVRHYGDHGEAREDTVTVFFETFAPPPRMLIFGAVDFTAALVRVAKVLGYRVTVCDAREVFATTRRFPFADEVVVDWPHRLLEREGATLGPADAVCVLTHDAKFDVPALVAALGTDAGYIGAMGSRRTHAARVERLREAGVGPGRPGPDPGSHRPGHRCPHPGGDRRVHLRGDHRGSDRPDRGVPPGQRRSHPLSSPVTAQPAASAGPTRLRPRGSRGWAAARPPVRPGPGSSSRPTPPARPPGRARPAPPPGPRPPSR